MMMSTLATTLYCHLFSISSLLHINNHVLLVLVVMSASAAALSSLLLQFDLFKEVIGLLWLLKRVMTTDLRSLLLISSRRHASLEVARGTLCIALRQSQHVLHLYVLQVLLDNGLCLLLVMAWSEARVEKLLRIILALGCTSANTELRCQIKHHTWADPLSHTQLASCRTR